MSRNFLADNIVGLYRFWHGRCRFKGAGLLLRFLSRHLDGLQRYPLSIPGIGTVTVDFRDHAGRLWLQHLLGDVLAPYELEDSLCKAVSNVMKDGEVFWDVGANLGMVTSAITRAFPHARICAFEPNPLLFHSIETLFRNRATIQALPFALSDEDKKVLLTIPRAKSEGASIRGLDYVLKTSGYNLEDVEQVEVHSVRGDSLIKGEMKLPPPHVLKIDVEGHEVAVLKGFTSTIAINRPIIFFEHLYLTDKEITDFVPAGYTLHSVMNESGTLTENFDRSVGHNSVLIPEAIINDKDAQLKRTVQNC